jgi:hypothetical protein
VSNYTVISDVSEGLKQILFTEFSKDAVIRNVVGTSDAAIVFTNPTQTAQNSSNRLSLWLYQITENEFLKNQPPARGSSADTIQFPPLPLNLHYLITPFAATGQADLLLLGKTMQVLHENAMVLLNDPARELAEELRVVLCSLQLDQLSRIWEALREPYRLSVTYEVRVTRVDSQHATTTPRVIERTAGFATAPVGGAR